MKTDRYFDQLEATVKQAKTAWDFERMREAIGRAKLLNEQLAFKAKQEQFRLDNGGK